MSDHNVFRDVPVYLWPVWALATVASWTIVPVLTWLHAGLEKILSKLLP